MNQKHMKDLSRDDLLKAYRLMVLSRRLDEKEIQLKKSTTVIYLFLNFKNQIQEASGCQLLVCPDHILICIFLCIFHFDQQE